MLTELDSKCTSLVKQNEWTNSKAASSVDSKHVAMTANNTTSTEQKIDQTVLLQALIASLQQNSSTKPADWIDLKSIPAPKANEPYKKTVKKKTIYYCDHCKK